MKTIFFKRAYSYISICLLIMLFVFTTGFKSFFSSPETIVQKHIKATLNLNKENFLATLSKQKRSNVVDYVWQHSNLKGDYKPVMKGYARKYQGKYKIESVEKVKDERHVKVTFENGRYMMFILVREKGWKIKDVY